MNVLLIGSGGRTHALADKLRQSPHLDRLVCAPGGPGTEKLGASVPLSIPNPRAPQAEIDTFLSEAVDLGKSLGAHLAIVSSEAELSFGLTDRFRAAGILCPSPTKAAAEIESSKSFGNKVKAQARVPHPPSRSFSNYHEALGYLSEARFELVLKADGLMRGKGVKLPDSKKESGQMLGELFSQTSRVTVEQRLSGYEISAHAFTDGHIVRHMPMISDYKRRFVGNQGPNTGSMGCHTKRVNEQLRRQIHDSTESSVKAMAEWSRVYEGVLFPGFLVDGNGVANVLEYNCRFGDPEAQCLLALLETDLLEILVAIAEHKLNQIEIKWSDEEALALVMCVPGYPDKPETGLALVGLEDIDSTVQVFQAGTARNKAGLLVSSSGRVVTLVAKGLTLKHCRDLVYAEAPKLKGLDYRSDLGEE